jgi:Tfp pilus assembly protein PilO
MKRFLTPIILILLSGGLYYWYTGPNYKAAQAASSTITSLHQTAQAAGNLGTLEQKVRNSYNALTATQVTSLEQLLPDNINTIELITELDSIGNKHGIAVQNISLTSQNAQGGSANGASGGSGGVISNSQMPYGTLPFTFTVTTSYPNFISFLQDLERSRQLFDVNSISVSSVTDKNDTYTFLVGVQTYWLL